MTRLNLVLVALFAAGGAGPLPPLPVPPIPPRDPPMAQSAPVPNPDLRGPQDLASRGVQVSITDFRAIGQDLSSMGYSPGSRFQSSEDRRSIQTPGLTVRVPLQ